MIGFSPAVSLYLSTGEMARPPHRYDFPLRNNDPPLMRHVRLSAFWLLLGVSQPLLIKFGYNGTHRILGKIGSLLTLTFAYSINKAIEAHGQRPPFLFVVERMTKALFQFWFLTGLYHIKCKNYISHKNCMFMAFATSCGVAVSRMILYFNISFINKGFDKVYPKKLNSMKTMSQAPVEMFGIVNTAFVASQLFQIGFLGFILYKSGQLFESNMIAFGKKSKDDKNNKNNKNNEQTKKDEWAFSLPNWAVLPFMGSVVFADIIYYKPKFGWYVDADTL